MTEAETPTPDPRRAIELRRIGAGRYKATNRRGGVLPIGSGGDPDFTPVELLLAAIAGCSAIDVDLITGKRADAVSLQVRAEAVKVRDEQGNRLTDLRVIFDVRCNCASGSGHFRRRQRWKQLQTHDEDRHSLISVGIVDRFLRRSARQQLTLVL